MRVLIFDGRVLGFILKIDHRLFRPFGLFLPNKQLWGVEMSVFEIACLFPYPSIIWMIKDIHVSDGVRHMDW